MTDGRQILSTLSQIDGLTELEQLRTEVQQLRNQRMTLLEQQRTIMELIGATEPEKIIHDIRNVLNERNLLRMLTEGQF